MHNRYAKLSLALIFAAMICGCGADKNVKRGEAFLVLGEYYDAANQFKQAYTKTPPKERDKRGVLAIKMAECYEKINATPKSIAAYRNVMRYKMDDVYTHLSYARQFVEERGL